MGRLRNWLLGAGIAAVGAIGTKKAIDYLRNRNQEDEVEEPEDQEVQVPEEEVAYAVVEPDSVQDFLDNSFGDPGRYVPNRCPKVFEYQDVNYMVIWAIDNQKNKNQMLAFQYTDAGREMIASVGYTPEQTDYNLKLDDTPFVIEVNEEQIKSGQGETEGATDVDLVLG